MWVGYEGAPMTKLRVSGGMTKGGNHYLLWPSPYTAEIPHIIPSGRPASADTLRRAINIRGYTPSTHQLFVNLRSIPVNIQFPPFINWMPIRLPSSISGTTLFHIRLFVHSNRLICKETSVLEPRSVIWAFEMLDYTAENLALFATFHQIPHRCGQLNSEYLRKNYETLTLESCYLSC